MKSIMIFVITLFTLVSTEVTAMAHEKLIHYKMTETFWCKDLSIIEITNVADNAERNYEINYINFPIVHVIKEGKTRPTVYEVLDENGWVKRGRLLEYRFIRDIEVLLKKAGITVRNQAMCVSQYLGTRMEF